MWTNHFKILEKLLVNFKVHNLREILKNKGDVGKTLERYKYYKMLFWNTLEITIEILETIYKYSKIILQKFWKKIRVGNSEEMIVRKLWGNLGNFGLI